MKLRCLFTQCTGVLAATAMMGTIASAHELHVSGWNIETVKGAETIQLNWSEKGSVEVLKFPAAEQVIVKIPNAHLEDSAVKTLNIQNSSFLRDAKLQEISLSDGSPAVQIRMNLKQWQELETNATDQGFTITAKSVTKNSAPESNLILLSNEDIDAWKAQRYGSAKAPIEGAGQAAAPNSSGTAIPFYVPPDLTPEEKAAADTNQDFGLQSTEELFDKSVNLDFKDAELENVIRSIANKLDMNLILMPGDVSGRVTVSLSNVRLGDAFDAMLKSNGLAYKIEQGGIVRIVPRADVQATEKETVSQVLTVNWVDSAELSGILSTFLSDVGQITNHQQSNTIIVEDVPENVSQIQEIVQRLDVPEKQVRMETRLVDMSEAAFRGLGFQNNVVSEETKTFLGVDGAGVVDATGDPIVQTDLVGVAGGFVSRGSGLDLTSLSDFTFLGNKFALSSRITAAETRGEALTLAAPTIVSLNNVASLIEIKRQIPYLDATNTTEGSVSTVRFVDVGTRVEITPRITNNGYVVMDILPEQKIQVGTDATTQVPIIDERFYQSSVIAKDEQTIVVGGLRQFEGTNSEAGIPWILRAPVIGWFFKTTTNNQNRVELYLFVTPTIIKDPEPTSYERSIYDKIDYNWDLPDYYFDNVEFRESEVELNDPRMRNELLN